jgi:hypothetical protein
VTTPLPLETPLGAETTEAPETGVKLTVSPVTGALLPSNKVTVTVEVATPSAATEVGLATAVEFAALVVPVAYAEGTAITKEAASAVNMAPTTARVMKRVRVTMRMVSAPDRSRRPV